MTSATSARVTAVLSPHRTHRGHPGAPRAHNSALSCPGAPGMPLAIGSGHEARCPRRPLLSIDRTCIMITKDIVAARASTSAAELARSTRPAWLEERIAENPTYFSAEYVLGGRPFASISVVTRRYGADVIEIEVSFWSGKAITAEE